MENKWLFFRISPPKWLKNQLQQQGQGVLWPGHAVMTNSEQAHRGHRWKHKQHLSLHRGEMKGILFKMHFTVHSLLSCTPITTLFVFMFVCTGLRVELWPVGETRGQHLAWWSGHHWVPSRGRSVGGNLDFEQRKPHQPRRVRRVNAQLLTQVTS